MTSKIKKNKNVLKKIIYLKLKSMSATSGPPIGPVLGQCGIPAGPFCKEFNERSEIFNSEVLLFVTIKLLITNEYIFDIELPNLSFFLHKSVFLVKGKSIPGHIFNSFKNIHTKTRFYKIITPYILYEILLYRYLKYGLYVSKSIFKQSLGTLRSIGLFITN